MLMSLMDWSALMTFASLFPRSSALKMVNLLSRQSSEHSKDQEPPPLEEHLNEISLKKQLVIKSSEVS